MTTQDSVRQLRPALLAASMAAGLIGLASPAQARITQLVINNTQSPALGGTSFGDAGQYEILSGTAYGELDPNDPHDAVVQDLNLAPRNANGRVAYSMDVYIMKPIDMSRANGSILYEIPNRGNKGTLSAFNIGVVGGNTPTNAGDGYLQNLGFTLAWGGWQGDLIPGPGALALYPPVAHHKDGSTITGRVMTDYEFATPVPSTVIGNSFVGPENGPSAASLDNKRDVLTMQVHTDDPPVVIPNSQWTFADCTTTPFPGTPSLTNVCLQGGFDTNHIYKLVYTAQNPLVLGIGFAATRDWVTFLRHAKQDDYGNPNPLAQGIHWVLGYGVSQDGRFERDYLHLGFNLDEKNRKVFDGMEVHVAGARMGLNYRFSLPGYNALQHETHLAATDDMPLAWTVHRDPVTGLKDGLLSTCEATNSCPVIFQTMSSLEWWQERMSLDTTDGLGRDLAIPSNVRIFHFAGTQHGPSATASAVPYCQQLQNPNPYQYAERALLPRLQAWAAYGEAPPKSRFPTVNAGTLVPPDQASTGFPNIPGVTYNGLVNNLPNLYRGPRFSPQYESGVITIQPPVPIDGQDYLVLVPKVNSDGNEIDGIQSVQLQAPIGTYTGWNLRAAGYSEGDLCFLSGSFIPFAQTAAEREASGDPRPSLQERYGSQAGYVAAVTAATKKLEAQGFMLPQDAQAAIQAAQQSNILP
ncbi:MAG: hypothetical protein JO264_05085 [Acidisphaera sp.]|nr:hypothetical protein [Acidisphaera sp.]